MNNEAANRTLSVSGFGGNRKELNFATARKQPGLTDEQQIIEGCKNGRREIQEHLYRMYYSTFLKICARYARDMMDAEQLLNDGFMKIFAQVGQYKGEGSFEGWMKRVMINTCLDYLKSKYLRSSTMIHANSETLLDHEVDQGSGVLSSLAFRDLVQLIQSLPVMTRTVFNMHVFEAYPHKQIAAQLQISEGTSQWHLHQARAMLQQKIKTMNSQKKTVS
jgi:RNA polymerase sigma factor (sigma-70 family)